jgi:hypothetical protein
MAATRATKEVPRPAQAQAGTVDARRWYTLGVLCLSLLIIVIDSTIVNVALPTFSRQLHASSSGLSGRLDLIGAALSVAAFTVATYTIIEAPDNGWLSVTTLGLAAAAIVLLALFVVWEARSDHPMLPLHLFRNPRFTGAGVSITVMFFALSGVVFLSTQIYQFVLGYSPLAAGVRALPSAAALAIFSPLGASLAKRTGAVQLAHTARCYSVCQ